MLYVRLSLFGDEFAVCRCSDDVVIAMFYDNDLAIKYATEINKQVLTDKDLLNKIKKYETTEATAQRTN